MVKRSEKPRAFSYLRFSTPEQAKGDSFRRQMRLAEEYCHRHGLELDQKLTFHDLGVSAFRGQNASAGKLAQFQEAVSKGLVPAGSFLLVESLDRVSRQDAVFAQMTLQGIVFTGVNVVTLTDGQLYSKERLVSEPMSLIMSLLIFIRANEESATKSRRLLAAWGNKKRLAASEGKPLTARTPGWIRLNKERGRYELIPERAKVVRDIFRKTRKGMGRMSLVVELNRAKVPVFGNGGNRQGKRWYESYLHKILTNPATYGVFTPHEMVHANGKKTRKPLEPIANYFPAVITEDEFREVALLLQSRSSQRGRHATKGPASILAGLMRCPRCGSVMTRVYKGKANGVAQLVCVKAKAGDGCKYHGVKVSQVEAGIYAGLPPLLVNPPLESQSDYEEVEKLVTSIDVLEDQLATLVDDFSKSGSQAIRNKITEYEAELLKMKAKHRELEQWQEVNGGPLLARNLTEASEKLLAKERDIEGTNVALRKLFDGIVVDYSSGLLIFKWKNGQESSCLYTFPE